MKQLLEYMRLIDMIKEIDLEKNSKENVREALNFIADELEKYEYLFLRKYKNEIKKNEEE